MIFTRMAVLFLAWATGVGALASDDLAGEYRGDINGTPSVLVLQAEGQVLQGEIDASGYRYLLQGQTDGARAEGQFSDPQTGTVLPFRIDGHASGLTLELFVVNALTGQMQPTPLQFSRVGTGGSPPASAPAPVGAGAAAVLDPRLIGQWSASDTMVSGDASFVSSSQVTFGADGTYLYSDGPAYVSGSSAYGSTSIESPGAEAGDRGRWRMQGDLLYTMPDATGQWQLLGRIYIEGNRALVYYPDGSRTVWNKR